jgi:hypothetical protein
MDPSPAPLWAREFLTFDLMFAHGEPPSPRASFTFSAAPGTPEVPR